MVKRALKTVWVALILLLIPLLLLYGMDERLLTWEINYSSILYAHIHGSNYICILRNTQLSELVL